MVISAYDESDNNLNVPVNWHRLRIFIIRNAKNWPENMFSDTDFVLSGKESVMGVGK